MQLAFDGIVLAFLLPNLIHFYAQASVLEDSMKPRGGEAGQEPKADMGKHFLF